MPRVNCNCGRVSSKLRGQQLTTACGAACSGARLYRARLRRRPRYGRICRHGRLASRTLCCFLRLSVGSPQGAGGTDITNGPNRAPPPWALSQPAYLTTGNKAPDRYAPEPTIKRLIGMLIFTLKAEGLSDNRRWRLSCSRVGMSAAA